MVSPSQSRRGRPRGSKQSPSSTKRKRGRPKKTKEVVEESEETLEDVEEQTQVVVRRAGRKRQSSSRTTKTAPASTSRAKRTKVVADEESPLEGDSLSHASSHSTNTGPCCIRMYSMYSVYCVLSLILHNSFSKNVPDQCFFMQ